MTFRRYRPRRRGLHAGHSTLEPARLRAIADEARRRFEALEERRVAALDGAGFPPSPHEVVQAERLMIIAEAQAEAAARTALEP